MNKLKDYIPKIVESLKKIDPYRIYIFGSVAGRNEKEESDIDIVVVLNKNEMPKSFDEKLENKVFVRNAIFNISLEVPIDLLVYSKQEFIKLKKINSSFASEILNKGSLIYERAS